MPNWCQNKLIVEGPEAEVTRFEDIAKAPQDDQLKIEGDGSLFSLSSFLPIPKDIVDGVKKMEEIYNTAFEAWHETTGREWELPKEYDYETHHAWKDWTMMNWGVKWDCNTWSVEKTISQFGCDLEIVFETAWDTPTQWLKTVSAMFPALSFTLEYIELGANVAGLIEAEDGSINDSSWDITPDDLEKWGYDGDDTDDEIDIRDEDSD